MSAIAFALVVDVAAAQPMSPSKPSGPSRSSTQFTLKRENAGGADGAAARNRARAGDCAGALASFDAAIRITIEPTLRRDRGLCHEKLGHPFPAVEDYRAYLTASPDALDAEALRQRLVALEEQINGTAGGGAVADEDNPELPSMARGQTSLATGKGKRTTKSARASRKDESTFGPREGEPARSYDYYAQQERMADLAASSPLRNGSGFVLGPFLQMPRFWVGDKANTDLAYGVGATFRYATGPLVSIISELGFAGIGTSGQSTAQSGPLLLGGIELRIPVSRWAGDHLLLRGGLGYERYVVSGSRAVTNNVLGRFAFGYRHVFGASIGLEILADGGPALVLPESGDNRVNAVIGASGAFVVGF